MYIVHHFTNSFNNSRISGVTKPSGAPVQKHSRGPTQNVWAKKNKRLPNENFIIISIIAINIIYYYNRYNQYYKLQYYNHIKFKISPCELSPWQTHRLFLPSFLLTSSLSYSISTIYWGPPASLAPPSFADGFWLFSILKRSALLLQRSLEWSKTVKLLSRRPGS